MALITALGGYVHTAYSATPNYHKKSKQTSPAKPKFQNKPTRNSEVVTVAKSLLDVDYKYGGNTPATGLDCSGFVRYVFKQAWGAYLPRTSRAISRKGIYIRRAELQPGDLVFYNTRHRKYSHVGIFVGKGRFIHSPSTGGQVRIDQMSSSYWRKRYNGGRRLKDPGT